MDDESSLIIVSNREPYIHEKTKKGIRCRKATGGLISALDSIMRSCNGLWIAWGSTIADFIEGDMIEVPPEDPKYKLKRIKLSENEIDNYYRGFSNRTLWPLFHLFIDKAIFSKKYWRYYQRVNSKFATAVLNEDEDFIWIHDYHLSLLPKLIKDENDNAKIAFFWHIPWVHWDVFNKIPWRNEILEGIFGSDLIGFHTNSYARNFIECAEKIGFSVDRRKKMINYGGRHIKVRAFPLGIDYKAFRKLEIKTYRLRKKMKAEKIIFGIDRLDYTKGILNRLLAFERFLKKYPEYKEKVTLIQVASPSRTKVEEYRKIKKEIDENVGRINAIFQTMEWTPIKYFYRTIPQYRLLQFYKMADIALITPLIDGMNLVVKEYIATNDLGAVILSEFTGAAEELKEAIIVNPNDVDIMADAMKNALEMSIEEKKKRFAALKGKVMKKDINWWFRSFFHEWRKIYEASW